MTTIRVSEKVEKSILPKVESKHSFQPWHDLSVVKAREMALPIKFTHDSCEVNNPASLPFIHVSNDYFALDIPCQHASAEGFVSLIVPVSPYSFEPVVYETDYWVGNFRLFFKYVTSFNKDDVIGLIYVLPYKYQIVDMEKEEKEDRDKFLLNFEKLKSTRNWLTKDGYPEDNRKDMLMKFRELQKLPEEFLPYKVKKKFLYKT